MEYMEVVGMAANTVKASESIEAAEQFAQLLISRTVRTITYQQNKSSC